MTATTTVLATAVALSPLVKGDVRLERVTAGTEAAGAGERLTAGYVAVRHGTAVVFGKCFKDTDEGHEAALSEFGRITGLFFPGWQWS